MTPSNLRGWLLYGEDPFSHSDDGPPLTQIVTGPDTPPAPGDGSVKLDPTAFDSFAESDTQAVLRTLQYAGTTIANIVRLSYSIFVPSSAGDPPTMQLAVTGVNNPDNFASLVFLPGANGNAAPNLDDWTTFTPSQAGVWRSTRDVLGPNGECLICRSIGGNPHHDDCTVPANCTAATDLTWQQITNAIPDAVLNGPSPDDGSLSFRIGRGDTGAGYLTNVVLNDDGYFFEED